MSKYDGIKDATTVFSMFFKFKYLKETSPDIVDKINKENGIDYDINDIHNIVYKWLKDLLNSDNSIEDNIDVLLIGLDNAFDSFLRQIDY